MTPKQVKSFVSTCWGAVLHSFTPNHRSVFQNSFPILSTKYLETFFHTKFGPLNVFTWSALTPNGLIFIGWVALDHKYCFLHNHARESHYYDSGSAGGTFSGFRFGVFVWGYCPYAACATRIGPRPTKWLFIRHLPSPDTTRMCQWHISWYDAKILFPPNFSANLWVYV
jgi:hypothetical protein